MDLKNSERIPEGLLVYDSIHILAIWKVFRSVVDRVWIGLRRLTEKWEILRICGG